MDNKEKNLAEIEDLKDSPLYAMSLGGRELYHSNFWVWLMKKDKRFINVFFGDDFESPEILREDNHHDITIISGGKIYIIENKIKSLSSKEQLDRYTEDLLKQLIDLYKKKKKNNEDLESIEKALKLLYTHLSKNKTESEIEDFFKNAKKLKEKLKSVQIDENKKIGLLTGLVKSAPDFIKDSLWEYKSYEDIVDSFPEDITEYKDIITKYIKDVKNLSYAVNTLLKEHESDYSFANAEILECIRFDDTYKKLKMEYFANTVALNKIGDKQKDGFELKKVVDYSPNKKANLTVKYEKIVGSGRKKEKYAIGIQIEEYEFRYFAEAPDLATDTCIEKGDRKTFYYLVNTGWFVSDNTTQFHGKTLVSTGKPCNKYEPDFIHQYYKIEEGISYKEVRDAIYAVFKSDSFKNSFNVIKKLAEEKLNSLKG